MADYLDSRVDIADPAFVDAFDEATLWSARFGAWMLDHLPIRPGLDVLDVGCGTGFPLFELANCVGPTCRLTGVDCWAQAIERAERKRRVYGLPNVRLVCADAARMPFADESFDLIVSNLGVNNFADPAAALAECARVARRGATFALTTNIRGHFAEFYEVFRNVLSESRGTDCLARLDAHKAHRGTRDSVTALVESAGFAIQRVEESQFQMHFADGSAMLRHWLVRIGFLDGWRSVVARVEEHRAFAELESRLNQLDRPRGSLAMTVPMLFVDSRRE